MDTCIKYPHAREEVHMNHVRSSIGFLMKLAHPSSWISQHGPLITLIALVISISNQWSMPFPIKMWAITHFICWYETKWCWYETKWHCWSEFGVGSCANEVEDSVSFVSRSSPSIQVMIPCSNTARSCLLVMYFSKLFGICRIKDLLYIFIFVGWNCSMLFGWMNAVWVTTDSMTRD